MREIDSNQHAWSQIAEDHYHHFRKTLADGTHRFNSHILRELGDLTGKQIIHLQCNTGADSILLARMGAACVTGVDLVPENVRFAKKLAEDLSMKNLEFIQGDLMQFPDLPEKSYDVVFTSEGAICWLPDLPRWGRVIRSLLHPDGFFYCYDSHPFLMTFDEEILKDRRFEIKYPYFSKRPDVDDIIGGYACEPKSGVAAYSWMYTVSDIINSLAAAGLRIEWFNEFKELFFDCGGFTKLGDTGLFALDYNDDLFPMSFSVKATVSK